MKQDLGKGQENPDTKVARSNLDGWVRLYSLAIAIAWSALVGVLLLNSTLGTKQDIIELARTEARTAIQKDITYRYWASIHGGVYVPATETTPPNPYLANIPERDIITPSGRALTLVNPAYMTRQVHELGEKIYGFRGHITSLNPLRPENAPDEWEASALRTLAQGETEYSETVPLDSKPYLRLMLVLNTDQGCLKCHAEQGYKLGDVRGGISVSVPMQPYELVQNSRARSLLAGYGSVWALGLCGLGFGTLHLRRRMNERNHAVEALQASEKRWQFALEGNGDGAWDWDVEKDRVYYSSQWKAMLGFADHEIGDTYDEWERRLHPDDRASVLDALDRYLRREAAVFLSEHRLHCKDGSYKWILDRGKVIKWSDDGKPLRIIGTHSDISERKQAEVELRSFVERATRQQEAVASIAVLPALISGDVPGVAVRLTELAAQVTGVERVSVWLFDQDEVELRCVDLYEASSRRHSAGAVLRRHEYEHEFNMLETAKYVDANDPLTDPRTSGYVEGYLKPMRITSMLDAVIRTGGKNLGTLCFEHVDRPHQWAPDEISFVCQLSDQIAIAILNCERKRADDALRQSEARNTAMRQAMPDMMFLLNRDGVFLDYHAVAEDALAIAPEVFLGRNISDLLPDGVGQLTMSHIRELSETGHTAPYEYDLILNGETRYFESRMVSCGEEYFLALVRDITERKSAETAHEKLEAQLRQSQKMEAVGQLAGGVAHDFNNLLQAILGYTELVREHLGPENENEEALKEIHKAAGRAADLTRQLLAFSRRQIIQPVNLDLNALLQGFLSMIRRVIGEHIELHFLPAADLGTVRVDKGQMEQIVMNLCVNARDAMPKGGSLTIETSNVLIDETYCRQNPWATEGRYVLMSVTDTGHGMDEAVRSQIFEPFFTTKDVGQGTGLGLATVYGIVKHHQGLIQVQSEPDKGAVFNVYIPIVELPSEEIGMKVERNAEGGSETILVAEDNEMVRSLVVRLLETAGYTVVSAVDGEEALRLFEEHFGKIHMALLDVIMPKLGGRDVMERIQARCPTMRFLFSSGYNDNAVHTDFVIKEGLNLINKPHRGADLLRAVRETLDRPPSL